MNFLKENTVIIVFGASGDLAKKKTFPALFALYREGLLPEEVKIVGYARTRMDKAEFEKRATSYITGIEKNNDIASDVESFKSILSYVQGGYQDVESFQKLTKHIEDIGSEYEPMDSKRIFYLALPPSVFIPVLKNVKENCYIEGGINRIIIETPFGKDLESARKLLDSVKQYWTENETFRIDHYLGKKLVKNLLVLRFANIALSSAWDKNSISNVQIILKESFGTEGRGGYFDEFGIIRDVLQNHSEFILADLLQVLIALTMERPVSFSAERIRDEKIKVLQCISPIVQNDTLLGQYVAANGKPGYLDDDTVPQGSVCPTYAATTLWINNSRWEGVPFILEAGKALDESKVEVRIQFRDVSQGIFPDVARNELVIQFKPNEAIYWRLNMGSPAMFSRVIPTEMDLPYNRSENVEIPEAYEALIVDALRGDHSSFVRNDELEAAWKIFTPILHWIDGKTGSPPTPLKYPYGSKGPTERDAFVEKYGYKSIPTAYPLAIPRADDR